MCGTCHQKKLRKKKQLFCLARPRCRAEEARYEANTDFSSVSEDSMSFHSEFHQVPFKTLLEKVDEGDYDQVLLEIKRNQAYLQFVEGRVHHAKAGILSGNEKEVAFRDAHNAAARSVDLLQSLPPETSEKMMLAEALLLEANTLAHLAKEGEKRKDEDIDFQKMFETASRKSLQAIDVLEELQPCNEDFKKIQVAKARRVQAVVEINRGAYEKAEKHLKECFSSFLNSEAYGKWLAIALWNKATIEKSVKGNPVPWLKLATLLQEQHEGRSHPYKKLYRDELVRLTTDTAADQLGLSKDEVVIIEKTVGPLPKTLMKVARPAELVDVSP